jgi:L-2-hydroxyglutarate oxidase LhgO
MPKGISEPSGSNGMVDRVDVAVIGAGIVGLATALALRKANPDLSVVVIDKEAQVGRHQTGHNSGVVHSGVYYQPGSLKARLCVEGSRRLEAFCAEHQVPFERVGKVIVAVQESELDGMRELHRRGSSNGVLGLELLDARGLATVEPHVSGIGALYVPSAGIVDFGRVAGAMAGALRTRDVAVLTETTLLGARPTESTIELATSHGRLTAAFVVNCAGLQADRVATAMGAKPSVKIVPFRGEYYELRPARVGLVRGLVYPVPDARLPFLGVHLTRTIDGRVEAGPNAVLAFAREGYRWAQVNARDLYEVIGYRGFRRLARHYWRTGLQEIRRSASRGAFARNVRRLVPSVRVADLVRAGSGVRAQAVAPDGRLVDDFVFEESDGALHVLNAPSPGATSSLAIGEHVAERVRDSMDGSGPGRSGEVPEDIDLALGE